MLVGLGTLSVVVICTLALSSTRAARVGGVVVWLSYVGLSVGGHV